MLLFIAFNMNLHHSGRMWEVNWHGFHVLKETTCSLTFWQSEIARTFFVFQTSGRSGSNLHLPQVIELSDLIKKKKNKKQNFSLKKLNPATEFSTVEKLSFWSEKRYALKGEKK